MMIELKNASKRYGEKVILDNVSFKFEQKNLYWLTGVNGVGKTTLLNIIIGYEKLDSGHILLPPDIKVQYMYQPPLLFSNLSIYDNMLIKYLSCHDNDRSIDEYKIYFSNILKKLNINNDLDTPINRLSGGEMRRITLSQYMMDIPDIILLDEPTSNIDSQQKKYFYNLIDKLFPSSLKILITHDDVSEKEGIVLELSGGCLCQKTK